MEQWIDCTRFPGYQVSSHGRVRNTKTSTILKSFPDRHGYLKTSIGAIDNVYIHRLICEAFYGLPENDNYQVNHIDSNRQNNHVLNLEWCSPKENVQWAVRNGNCNPMIGLEKAIEANYKPVRLVESKQVFPSIRDCAEFLGVEPTHVSRCLTGSRKGQKLHGYHIEYV